VDIVCRIKLNAICEHYTMSNRYTTHIAKCSISLLVSEGTPPWISKFKDIFHNAGMSDIWQNVTNALCSSLKLVIHRRLIDIYTKTWNAETYANDHCTTYIISTYISLPKTYLISLSSGLYPSNLQYNTDI
jgi:hypothetical protein